MSLFNELKRRNVFRVGAAYLVVAWLLLQIMDTVGPIVGFSDSFARGVLFLLAIGFPIVLIVSWVYELTPEGIQTQANADASGTQSHAGKLNAVIIAGLVLALVLVVLDAYVFTDETADAAQGEINNIENLEKTIAVLPFANLSADQEQAYFADGITEEILNSLTRLRGLQVTARTSSFYFKGKNIDLKEVGETLDVNYILEGSVRKAGEQLRITAQLIKADDGFHLWSETYDRQFTDVFAIQDEISNAVADILSIALGVGEVLGRPGMTRDVEAYDLYLQSRDISFFTASETDLRRIISNLERAVSLDPEFALSWVMLASVYAQVLSEALPIRIDDIRQKYNEAIGEAEALIPGSPAILALQAEALETQGEWLQALELMEEAFLQGQETYVPDESSVFGYAYLLKDLGRVRESIIVLEQAIARDPLNWEYSFQLMDSYADIGDVEASYAEARRGLALDGDDINLAATSFATALAENDRQQIMEWFNVMKTIPSSLEFDQVIHERMIELLEEPDKALSELRQFSLAPEAQAPIIRGSVIPLWAAYFGDTEYALAQMRAESIATQRSFVFATWRPLNREIRRLDGFKEMMTELGLVDYWRSTGEWGDFCQPLEGGDDFECF